MNARHFIKFLGVWVFDIAYQYYLIMKSKKMKKGIVLNIVLLFFFGAVFVAVTFLQIQESEQKDTIAALPAFPGAEGFGSLTPGGRFGKVIFVTNLNDTIDVNSPDYPGSLRWAVSHTWPEKPDDPFGKRRIIIFKTGGIIKLVDNLIIDQPFVTIAGQTAPGDGIVVRGDQVTIATHDVIVRGIRVRVGDEGEPTCCRDGINISTTNANSDVYNIIVDHSSISWAIDENVSTWTSASKPYKTHDITIQWSIISEALHNSIHVDEGADDTDPHSMGMIIGQDGYNVTIHHNLFANNWGRNPLISGMINTEILNNVIYGWGDAAVQFNSDKNTAHVLDNYFIGNSESKDAEIFLSKTMDSESQIYLKGNVVKNTSTQAGLIPARTRNSSEFPLAKGYVFASSGIVFSSSEAAYTSVLTFAGATGPIRDEVDQRVVDNVINQTGQIIDSQDQVGGWPDYQTGQYPTDSDNDGIPDNWEQANGLDSNSAMDANNPNFLAPSGYTWLEAYMNSLLYTPKTTPGGISFFDALKNFIYKILGSP